MLTAAPAAAGEHDRDVLLPDTAERAAPPAPAAPAAQAAAATPEASAATPEASATATPEALAASVVGDDGAMAQFLDRLMLAESGGRDDARNPRSTAVGPFQFIESTFLDVCRRHFAAETATLSPVQILALRTDRAFARRAAEAFTRDNAGVLAANEIQGTKANLRLAFLLGSGGAVRVLKADPAHPVIALLGANVVQANPFMAGMTAHDLQLWSARNLAGQKPDAILLAGGATTNGTPGSPELMRTSASGAIAVAAGPPPPPPPPSVTVSCNLDLPSCRRFLMLAQRRAAARHAKTVVAAEPRRKSRVR